jgi:hypothetical protein
MTATSPRSSDLNEGVVGRAPVEPHSHKVLSFRGLRVRGRVFRGLGGWDGKPLHAPLASVPIGTTVAAAIFDSGSRIESSRELYRAATAVLIIGQLFVALATLTGCGIGVD